MDPFVGTSLLAAGAFALLHRTPIDIARRELGVASIGGRFRGPPFERYAIEGEIPLAWCARFVRFCFEQAGRKLPGNRFLIPSVAQLRAALLASGQLLEPTVVPQANDIILLEGTAGNADGIQIGGHHTGIVERVDGDFVDSIDGDFGTPDQVTRVRRRRDASDIWGYGRVG